VISAGFLLALFNNQGDQRENPHQLDANLPLSSIYDKLPVVWHIYLEAFMKKLAVAAMIGLMAFQSPLLAETARVNGADIHYETKGAGEPLLLLHGFGSCAAEWSEVTNEFAKQYQVIAVDMRGHGKSTNPSGRFTHRQSAEDIRALIDGLKIKTARAIGFSSGAMTLLHVATKYPDRLSNLVVVSGATYFPEDTRAILRGVSYDNMPPPVKELYERCASRGETQVRELVGQFRAFGDMQDDMNLSATDLGNIKASTLIVHGDRDMFFPVSIPLAMYAGIQRSALWIVPGGDHSPQAGADMDMFINIVSSALATKSAP
jgi:pimeloyl-ACP methyl ester carboxylesterase